MWKYFCECNLDNCSETFEDEDFDEAKEIRLKNSWDDAYIVIPAHANTQVHKILLSSEKFAIVEKLIK